MTQLGLSNELGQFISRPFFCDKEARPGDDALIGLRKEAFEIIKMGMTDTVATMFAAIKEPVADLLFKNFQESGVMNNDAIAEKVNHALFAPVPVYKTYLNTQHAGFLNASLGHALDYDDVALSGHPSVVLGPAVWAVGHALDASGEKVLEAYWVGYEVWAELISRETDQYHLKGWHPTAVLGTVACAAAVAHLYQLNPIQATHAISLAASMASGLTANFGSMSKPMQAGRAVFNAIEAVNLAKSGMEASSAVFESKAGFLNAISPKGNVDTLSAAKCLNSTRITNARLSIKQYPMCYSAHRVIDGVLDEMTSQAFKYSDVLKVQAFIGPAQASMLRNHLPQNGLEAKFSLEFSVASALLVGKVGLSELSDEFVKQDAVQELMKRVKVEVIDTKCPIDPAFSINDRVIIYLKNGQEIDSGDIRFSRGNAFLPVSNEALKQKFLDCWAYGGLKDETEYANTLYEKLSHFQDLKSVRSLFTNSIS
ncbi:MAG: MmgE/PrpD family protein [Betaproteobacteria bacterium]